MPIDLPTSHYAKFEPYGPSHWAALAVFAVVAVALVRWGRANRGTGKPVELSRDLAVFLCSWQLPMQVFQLVPLNWNIEESLPLQLCDLAWIVAVYALWTDRPSACALLYYWGLTLTSQSLVTPTLETEFPSINYFMFWVFHIVVVVAAIYTTFVRGLSPTWRSYGVAAAVTGTWMVAVFIFNSLAGTNYGYLNRKPEAGTLLDVLGPWPLYLLVEIVIAAALWALMTWPFESARHRRARAAEGGRDRVVARSSSPRRGT